MCFITLLCFNTIDWVVMSHAKPAKDSHFALKSAVWLHQTTCKAELGLFLHRLFNTPVCSVFSLVHPL